LADGICKVLESNDYREKLISNGLDFASNTNWDNELKKIADYLNSLK
jgi:hypothetical protein